VDIDRLVRLNSIYGVLEIRPEKGDGKESFIHIIHIKQLFCMGVKLGLSH
jgi:hypothetical protein